MWFTHITFYHGKALLRVEYTEHYFESVSKRSGGLPEKNRILWRGDSGLKDGCDNKVDLTGGWYDAGDYVKFGFPMAFSTTLLSWGIINYQTAYNDAKQLKMAYTQITWPLDYFVKCHTKVISLKFD